MSAAKSPARADGFVLYDDAQARAMEPFALTRPGGEVRVGGMLMRHRWERVLGCPASGFIGAPHLAAFQEFDSPAAVSGTIPIGIILVNARFAPALDATVPALQPGEAVVSGGAVVAVAVGRTLPPGSFVGAAGTANLNALVQKPLGELAGWWLNESWDLVRYLRVMLTADAAVLAADIDNEPPAHVSVIGEHRLAAARGSYFEPHVVVDTTNGDVVVESGARINAFTRLAGPCVIGANTIVHGGRISACSVGESSRVSGELSATIVCGHANKTHDGFVGDSVIGRWVNVGAGTTTSNLKNSYGSVQMRTSRGDHDTGMQFLGSLIGDHAKLAIGTRLMTGTIIGAGANVFGDRSPEKLVPPFAWGDRAPFEAYELDKFLDVAALVMERREVKLTDRMRTMLSAAWKSAQAAR